MNIFVIATTLQVGGGITIYNQFINHLSQNVGKNKYWVFINPKLNTKEIEGVSYIIFPLQSKLKRILFEGKLLLKECKRIGVKPDIVISLQNNGYKCFQDAKHIVYFHQALPLYPGTYNPFKKAERLLFKYKFIFPHIVRRTWASNTHFIVQTSVVKKRFSSFFRIDNDKIHVCFPDLENIESSLYPPYNWEDNKKHLIFVGNDYKYRNGLTLVRAIKVLRNEYKELTENIIIHVTSSIEDAPVMYREIVKEGVLDNFVFEGVVPHDKLLSLYKSAAALVFPSSIETVGLPMLEAAAFGLPVLAADADFVYDVMKDYEGVIYSDVRNYKEWAHNIKSVCECGKCYRPLSSHRKSDWINLFNLMLKIV